MRYVETWTNWLPSGRLYSFDESITRRGLQPKGRPGGEPLGSSAFRWREGRYFALPFDAIVFVF